MTTTGLEIVSVVLGVAQLILAGIDHWRSRITGKEMKQLERIFKTQHTIFLNTVEEIFAPLVPDSQLRKLLQSPNEAAWRDTQISSKLKEHLGESYEAFEEIMADIHAMMNELQRALDPKGLGTHRVIKRVKVFLSRSSTKAGMARLDARIGELETIKGQRYRLTKLYAARTRKTIATEMYKRVQTCAMSLHSALSRRWHCGCETPHLANLRLEARKAPQATDSRRRSGDDDFRFRFLFSFTGEENGDAGTIKGTRTQASEGSRLWREAELAPLDPILISSLPESREQLSSSSATPPSANSGPINSDSRGKWKTNTQNGQEQGEEALTEEHVEIKDLCQCLKNLQIDQPIDDEMLGYLSGADGARYGLYSVNSGHDPEPRIFSFHIGNPLAPSNHHSEDEPSGPIVRNVSERDKYQLAFTLASTMLQLHSTPWLDRWVKQDIVYLPEPGDQNPHQTFVHPYISRRISTGNGPEAAALPPPSTVRLQEYVRNETLFTLGIVLIEIAFNKPIEKLALPEELAVSSAIAPCLTAMRLHKQMQGKMGTRYQRAVAGCLVCDFGAVSDDVDLKDAEVQRKFLEHVVVPLEESMEFFSSNS